MDRNSLCQLLRAHSDSRHRPRLPALLRHQGSAFPRWSIQFTRRVPEDPCRRHSQAHHGERLAGTELFITSESYIVSNNQIIFPVCLSLFLSLFLSVWLSIRLFCLFWYFVFLCASLSFGPTLTCVLGERITSTQPRHTDLCTRRYERILYIVST